MFLVYTACDYENELFAYIWQLMLKTVYIEQKRQKS